MILFGIHYKNEGPQAGDYMACFPIWAQGKVMEIP